VLLFIKKIIILVHLTISIPEAYTKKHIVMKKQKKQKPVLQSTHVEFDAHLLENEVWLTTEEAMAHLNISRSTIYRLRKHKHIPNFKLGNIPMYPKHLLNKLFMQKAMKNVKVE
jgi:excisionase family DNA binding protein